MSVDNSNLILDAANSALISFGELRIYEAFEQYKHLNLRMAGEVLDAFQRKGLNHYDIFRIAGFVAREESFSDAIASLLDPNRPHQLGRLALKSALEMVRHRDETRIAAILAALDKPGVQISVCREFYLGTTIPDISIRSSEFVIFIENKMRGGCETSGQCEPQTVRQWAKIQELGKSAKIPEEFLLGIFLTPEGKPPREENFVPMSVSELVGAIRRAAEEAPACNSASMISAFLDFYDGYSWRE